MSHVLRTFAAHRPPSPPPQAPSASRPAATSTSSHKPLCRGFWPWQVPHASTPSPALPWPFISAWSSASPSPGLSTGSPLATPTTLTPALAATPSIPTATIEPPASSGTRARPLADTTASSTASSTQPARAAPPAPHSPPSSPTTPTPASTATSTSKHISSRAVPLWPTSPSFIRLWATPPPLAPPPWARGSPALSLLAHRPSSPSTSPSIHPSAFRLFPLWHPPLAFYTRTSYASSGCSRNPTATTTSPWVRSARPGLPLRSVSFSLPNCARVRPLLPRTPPPCVY
mmetsp:Transcript_17514/g.42737  ORF Transcript_17514/g.42737 Transcript_17514/m.42737 type:complete len:287 (+) Transcript_17514:709-1569(+)